MIEPTDPDAPANYRRAVAASPELAAVERMVRDLCSRVRPGDGFCAGCAWESYVKPLTEPWVGWERGYPPEPAREPDAPFSVVWDDQLDEWSAEMENRRTPAEGDTEKWLRTSEAYDAFTDVVLANLAAAERVAARAPLPEDVATYRGPGRTAIEHLARHMRAVESSTPAEAWRTLAVSGNRTAMYSAWWALVDLGRLQPVDLMAPTGAHRWVDTP